MCKHLSFPENPTSLFMNVSGDRHISSAHVISFFPLTERFLPSYTSFVKIKILPCYYSCTTWVLIASPRLPIPVFCVCTCFVYLLNSLQRKTSLLSSDSETSNLWFFSLIFLLILVFEWSLHFPPTNPCFLWFLELI